MPTWGQAAEDYLKAIYKIESADGVVSTSALANQLGVSDASATSMSKRLAQLGLVVHAPYRGVRLTEAGRKAALEIVRHHRLLELYLTEVLGFGWDQVHAEADRLEHVISEEFEERIDVILGRPSVDPHGDPIPTKELEMEELALIRLVDLDSDLPATIQRVSDRDPEALRELAALGLVPSASLTVTGRKNGALQIALETVERTIRPRLAAHVYVLPIEKPIAT